jgi:hypothetical protein
MRARWRSVPRRSQRGGVEGSSGGGGGEKRGEWKLGVWAGAWSAILVEGALDLAPACQLQENLDGDYRGCGGCDKRSGLAIRSRSASE